MKSLKRTWALVLSLVMVVSLAAGCGTTTPPAADGSGSAAAGLFTPGTYEGEATGYGGLLKVSVEVDADKILKVAITENKETESVAAPALEKIPAAIVDQQSVAVDAIAGCTIASNAIIEAVKVALAKSGADMSLLEKKAEAPAAADKTNEKQEADVVIVGGGGAGLAAGVAAYENGATSVILLEKMSVLGGNTVLSGGAYNAVDPVLQPAQGIEDSVEKHITQTYEGGHKVGNMDLIKLLCTNALDGIHWLEGYGLEFKDTIGSVVGSMWKRTHQAVPVLGTGYIDTLSKVFTDKGGVILMETQATELVKDADGRVTGVKAESPKAAYELTAKNGVILATGGYAANVEMARAYLSDGVYTKENLPADITTTNHVGATGDGIKMAESAGAKLIDMQHVQLLPMPSDRFGPSINVEDSFFINKEAVRFVKEDGARDEICLAAFAQTDGQYYMINDSKIIGADRLTTSGEKLDDLIAKGTVVEAATLDELAAAIGVPADALKATTDQFNTYATAKKDNDFGRAVWGGTIDKGPFYATLRFPALHHTMGGVQINTKAEVMDAQDQVIPGLYAAGEVTGGIHGGNRLGGNAIADTMVFGRIAGASVMGKEFVPFDK